MVEISGIPRKKGEDCLNLTNQLANLAKLLTLISVKLILLIKHLQMNRLRLLFYSLLKGTD